MIEKNEVEEIQIFSILDRGKPTGESDAVVFITFNKKEGLTTFHVWDDYTEETDMNEKINEMKLLCMRRPRGMGQMRGSSFGRSRCRW